MWHETLSAKGISRMHHDSTAQSSQIWACLWDFFFFFFNIYLFIYFYKKFAEEQPSWQAGFFCHWFKFQNAAKRLRHSLLKADKVYKVQRLLLSGNASLSSFYGSVYFSGNKRRKEKVKKKIVGPNPTWLSSKTKSKRHLDNKESYGSSLSQWGPIKTPDNINSPGEMSRKRARGYRPRYWAALWKWAAATGNNAG